MTITEFLLARITDDHVAAPVHWEPVAQLCVSCLDEVPAWWGCDDCATVEDRRYCMADPEQILTRPCPQHAVMV